MYFLGYCSGLYPVINLVKIVIKLIQFAVPIALILFGSIDFAKAVIANKEDEMKKAQSIFIKRLIYAVAVFFVIVIVRLVMNVLSAATLVDEGGNELSVNDWRRCWDCESLDECRQKDAAAEGQGDKIDWETEYPGSEYYDNVSYETFESDTDVSDPSKRITCYKKTSGSGYSCVREKLSSNNNTSTTQDNNTSSTQNASNSAPVLYSVKELGNGRVQVVHSNDAKFVVNTDNLYGETYVKISKADSSGKTIITFQGSGYKNKTITFYVYKFDKNNNQLKSNTISIKLKEVKN